MQGDTTLKHDHWIIALFFALSSNLPEKGEFKTHILIQEALVQEETIGTLMRKKQKLVCFCWSFLSFLSHLSNLCGWDGPEIGIELGCDQGIETRLSAGVWDTVVEKLFKENLCDWNTGDYHK